MNEKKPKEYPWREKIFRGKYGIKFAWRKRCTTGARIQITFQNPSQQEVIAQRIKLDLAHLNS